MTTLHEQAVETMQSSIMQASIDNGPLKVASGVRAEYALKALLSLIKDNEELVYDIAGKMAKEDVKSTNDAVRFTLAALTKALGDGE